MAANPDTLRIFRLPRQIEDILRKLPDTGRRCFIWWFQQRNPHERQPLISGAPEALKIALGQQEIDGASADLLLKAASCLFWYFERWGSASPPPVWPDIDAGAQKRVLCADDSFQHQREVPVRSWAGSRSTWKSTRDRAREYQGVLPESGPFCTSEATSLLCLSRQTWVAIVNVHQCQEWQPEELRYALRVLAFVPCLWEWERERERTQRILTVWFSTHMGFQLVIWNWMWGARMGVLPCNMPKMDGLVLGSWGREKQRSLRQSSNQRACWDRMSAEDTRGTSVKCSVEILRTKEPKSPIWSHWLPVLRCCFQGPQIRPADVQVWSSTLTRVQQASESTWSFA